MLVIVYCHPVQQQQKSQQIYRALSVTFVFAYLDLLDSA